MTENEAMDLDKLIADAKALSQEKDTLARTFRGFRDYGNPKSTITSGAEKAQKEAEQYEYVAKLFEELQQYRAIGTVKELQFMKSVCDMSDDMLKSLADAVRAKMEYEAIGTVEEFKALKEKGNKDFELLLKAVKESYPMFKGAYVELDVFMGDVMRRFTRDRQQT